MPTFKEHMWSEHTAVVNTFFTVPLQQRTSSDVGWKSSSEDQQGPAGIPTMDHTRVISARMLSEWQECIKNMRTSTLWQSRSEERRVGKRVLNLV